MSAHVWRGIIEEYRDRLPVSPGTPVVSLREGGTPLVRANRISELTGCEVFLKVEGANPTGSFKDRGMTMAISMAARVSGSPTMDSANTAAPRSQSSAVKAPPNTNQMTLPASRMMDPSGKTQNPSTG